MLIKYIDFQNYSLISIQQVLEGAQESGIFFQLRGGEHFTQPDQATVPYLCVVTALPNAGIISKSWGQRQDDVGSSVWEEMET